MEDYDVFNEMQNVKDRITIIVIEDDENFVNLNLLDSNIEAMPIRFSYDLSNFSDSYIDKTKNWFIFYYDEKNNYENELLRLKKHFVHYQRKPIIAYVPRDSRYLELEKMFDEIGIRCVSDKEQLIEIVKNKKIIFIDSDGTLRDSSGVISERVKKAIQENKKKGNKIIISTSRPRYQIIKVVEEVLADDIVISSNGSEIYDSKNKRIIFNSFIEYDELIKLVEYAYLKDIRLILTMDDYDCVTKDIRNSNQKLLNKNDYKNELINCNVKQCMFIDKNSNEIFKLKDILSKNDKLNIVDESNEKSKCCEKWFSIVNSNCSKGNAIKILIKYLNVPIENTIAIGNDKNDISMFEVAGLSVAVANASEDIKNKVDYITLSNDEDGVALFLESLL